MPMIAFVALLVPLLGSRSASTRSTWSAPRVRCRPPRPADPPRRRDQRQVRGGTRGDRADADRARRAGQRVRDPRAGHRPLDVTESRPMVLGWPVTRSSTPRSGSPSRCCCRSSSGAGRRGLVGFGTWFGLMLFGRPVLPLIANALFPTATTPLKQGLQTHAAQKLFLRLSPRSSTSVAGSQVILEIRASLRRCGRRLWVDLLGSGAVLGALAAVGRAVAAAGLAADHRPGRPDDVTFALAYVLFLRQEVRA